MDGVSIEVKGLKQLESNLRELGAQLGAKTLRSALRDAAKPIYEDMERNAPVGDYGVRNVRTKSGGQIAITPGYTKSRVKIRTAVNRKGKASKKFSDKTAAMVQVGVFRVPYIVPLEYGTSTTPAAGFIRGATRQTDQALIIFQQRLKRRIELARKRLAKTK